MTEEIAATPGWVDQRLDDVFSGLPVDATVAAVRERYADCLAGRKSPAAPSDMLGAEFNGCRASVKRELMGLGLDEAVLSKLDRQLESLEAEIAEAS